jgi:hypothetical protein
MMGTSYLICFGLVVIPVVFFAICFLLLLSTYFGIAESR